MTFKDAWNIIERRNANLVTSKKISMTPENIKKMCEWCYGRGAEEASSEGLFNSLFGSHNV